MEDVGGASEIDIFNEAKLILHKKRYKAVTHVGSR